MGGPAPVLSTTPCPWRPPNVLLQSSREYFWEMFWIRRRDDRGSEDRSGTIDNSCFELVERCRYVTRGMEVDLTPLHSTTDVSSPLSFVISFNFGPYIFLQHGSNHTCFDGTVKYYQPPHNFHHFCTLEILLFKMPLYRRFLHSFKKKLCTCTHNQHQHRPRRSADSNQKRISCSKRPLTLIIAWLLKQSTFFMKTSGKYCYLHLARSSPSSVEIKNSTQSPLFDFVQYFVFQHKLSSNVNVTGSYKGRERVTLNK